MLTVEEQTRTAPPEGTGAEKERAVQRMFSSIARYYDLNNSLLSLGLHHAWKRKAVEFLVDPPHPNPLGEPVALQNAMGHGARESVRLVLDVGAGTADLSLLAAQRLGSGARIVAADLNVPMLKIGIEKVRQAERQRQIICVQANAERLCVPDAAFDAVTTGFCMRNVGDLTTAFREILRALKPGGRLICLEFSRPVAGWLRRLYDWYSFTLLPWVGTKVSGDHTGVYEYLPASIRAFPDQEGLSRLMREVGFEKVECHNLSGGIVAIHVAVK
ncbi:MAG: ubiquinone/menaquinone biosynthesis methyltransferase [Nitrospirae bacterium]|nr:MAG: ubiquinone/menaquinone biosynthesis methyltransferase [Nitrospirota bacterium]